MRSLKKKGRRMGSYLDELYAHQEWADAEHWPALEAYPEALTDKAIRDRLMHIHLVQRAFLWVAGPRTSEFNFRKIVDFAERTDLKTWAQQGHAELNALLKQLALDRLEERIAVPWFKPPLKISIRHALTQCAMHSHYHRGQNATRLRELGGVPLEQISLFGCAMDSRLRSGAEDGAS
jgi:uncharacterized damage-inducible protein DinB